MSTKKTLYTKEGYEALEKEYEHLVNVEREEVKRDLSVARSYGDLSELYEGYRAFAGRFGSVSGDSPL